MIRPPAREPVARGPATTDLFLFLGFLVAARGARPRPPVWAVTTKGAITVDIPATTLVIQPPHETWENCPKRGEIELGAG